MRVWAASSIGDVRGGEYVFVSRIPEARIEGAKLNEDLQEVYGMGFPTGMPRPLVLLKIWKHWREPEYVACTCKEPWELFWEAIYDLIPRKEFIRQAFSEQHVYDWTTEEFVITWGSASSSKALPLGAEVQTPYGPVCMGDIKVGSVISAQDGYTSTVIKVQDVGVKEEYQVEFKDGTSCICCGGHLWQIGNKDGNWRREKVVTAEWLFHRMSKGKSSFYIPLGSRTYMQYSPVLIPPYLLGALLGDGSLGCKNKKGAIGLTSADPEIISRVQSQLEEGYSFRQTSKYNYHLVKNEDSRKGPGKLGKYKTLLEHYGLLGTVSDTKFIPRQYKYNSAHTRLELLRGLLDTDGTADQNGNVSFSSASEQLAKDVAWIIRSLGGAASISRQATGYKNNLGAFVAGKPTYIVAVNLSCGEPLFHLDRKQQRVNGRTSLRVRKKYIRRVIKTGKRTAMRCITVDNPDGLFMTNDFTVTHNSNDYGLLTLIDWMIDPYDTVSIMASTSVSMLKLRSYESVIRYFHLIHRYSPWAMPGKLRKTDDAIINKDDDEMGNATDKASIRGVAVAEGSEQEARAKLQGAHLPYVRLILDELSQMRPAAMAVRTNLSIGAKDFKLIGLCNPDSFTDLAARYSVPKRAGGFASLDPDVDFEWRSSFGKVRRHDGLQSPAMLEKDGEKKYPFMLTPSRYKQILAEHDGNDDSPEIWTMVRGFPPMQGKKQTLVTMNEILQSGATEDVKWYDCPSVTVLGVDPAFSEGGNRAVMQALDVGLDVNMQVKLSFREPRVIKIEASSKIPVLAQVGEAIKLYAEELSIPEGLVGVDDSATQSVADFIAHAYFMQVRRFVSNAKPSEMLVSEKDRMTAKERYYNQSTELWAATAAFIRAGQVRNIPMSAAQQLSQRAMEEDKRPLRLLSKKKSTRDGNAMVAGDSPDDMDAVSFCVGLIRYYLQMVAGTAKIPYKYNSSGYAPVSSFGLKQAARRYDLDARAYETEPAY